METIIVKVESNNAANILAKFLNSIEYIDEVSRVNDNIKIEQSMTKGFFVSGEKPSDFAGIWKNRKKIDSNKLRRKARTRRK